MSGKKWTEEEIAKLKELASKGYNYIEIAKVLGRSVHSVRIKARQLGIRKQTRKLWTKEEEERLKELLKRYSLSEIARILDRTRSSVASKVWELGLAPEHYNGIRNTTNINTNIPEWLKGYVAGMIDGDGIISIVKTTRNDRKEPHWKPLVAITNTNREALEFIAKEVGAFRFHNKRGTIGKNSKRPVYRIIIVRHKDVLVLLEMLLPYLMIKRRQAELVIDFCKSRLSKPNHAPYDDKEKEIIDEVKRLNKR
jgi:DNA-binding CsgD family transcriptional regulator